jgi:aryl-alcohol dehydrogenase-like predicted oxidoreductase
MKYREIGNSGVKCSALTFGAWAIGGWLWGGADRKEAVAAIREAVNMGMTSIDTAAVYGFGRSEEIVAEATRGRRHEVQILTKYGLRWNKTIGTFFFDSLDENGRTVGIYRHAGKESVMKECDDSLKRLKTDYIDLYQIHWPDPKTPMEDTMEAIDRLLATGKILAAGVSNYSLEQLAEARKYTPVCSNQVPFSMVNRSIEEKLVPYCVDNKVAILAYSPMQRGLLTGKFKPGHHFNEGDNRPDTPYFREPNFSRINQWLTRLAPVAKSYDLTLGQLVLAWTLCRPGITITLAGARNPQQVKENIVAANIRLKQADIEKINGLLEELKLEI